MNKILSILLLMSTPFVFAAATDDNEIMITQVGDTLKLYVDQVGFGNKVGLNDFSSGSGSNMTITGVTLDFNIDMIGNKNLLFGPLVADTSNYAISMTGDSNAIDWNIGSTGSSDDSPVSSSGSKITIVLPNSSMVVVKSVPLIVILAVGVDTSTFCFLILEPPPEANRAVPRAIRIDILDKLGSGS